MSSVAKWTHGEIVERILILLFEFGDLCSILRRSKCVLVVLFDELGSLLISPLSRSVFFLLPVEVAQVEMESEIIGVQLYDLAIIGLGTLVVLGLGLGNRRDWSAQ